MFKFIVLLLLILITLVGLLYSLYENSRKDYEIQCMELGGEIKQFENLILCVDENNILIPTN